MLKLYIAFMWDGNGETGMNSGWDHIVTDKDGQVCSWDSPEQAREDMHGYIEKFKRKCPRLPEIKTQIIPFGVTHRYFAFVWDSNREDCLNGGWDHVITNEQGDVCGWDTIEQAREQTRSHAETFKRQLARLPAIIIQIVDLETRQAVISRY